jgi:hypothetical protein
VQFWDCPCTDIRQHYMSAVAQQKKWSVWHLGSSHIMPEACPRRTSCDAIPEVFARGANDLDQAQHPLFEVIGTTSRVRAWDDSNSNVLHMQEHKHLEGGQCHEAGTQYDAHCLQPCLAHREAWVRMLGPAHMRLSMTQHPG